MPRSGLSYAVADAVQSSDYGRDPSYDVTSVSESESRLEGMSLGLGGRVSLVWGSLRGLLCYLHTHQASCLVTVACTGAPGEGLEGSDLASCTARCR